MQVGVFVPINNNGWLISENAPQYKPSFDLNKQIAQSAEAHGLDFLLSMIKLRGFGGKTEFWEYGLASFTLMAGIAALTDKIKIYATCGKPASPTSRANITRGKIAASGPSRRATSRSSARARPMRASLFPRNM